MNKFRNYILLTAMVGVASVSHAQGEEHAPESMLQNRTVSLYSSLGFPELTALGFQYQLNDEFALGVKAGLALAGGHDLPVGGFGGGIKSSYFFDRSGSRAFLGINVVNVEASYLATSNGGAVTFEATTGHDSIVGKGIGFLWLIGIYRGGFPGERDRPFIFPALKIGLHLDL